MESINERKLSDERDEKRDLLSNLVDANEEFLDDGEQRLAEVELIGTWPGLDLPTLLLTHTSPRKRVHFLHRWTRGEDTLTNTLVDLNGMMDVWARPLFRPEHARDTPRRTRGIVPTHSKCSPRWPPTSK